MNISKFVVLGTLDYLGKCSGYEITKELDKKMISRWTDVKKGSIYHALKSLKKNGEVREISKERNGLYPEMTIYEISDKGRELFDSMQEEAFNGLFPHFYGFKIALKFNVRRSNREIREFAEKAIKRIEMILAGQEIYLSSFEKASPRYRYDNFFIEHDRMLLHEEKRWIEMAVSKLDFIKKITT